MRLFSNKKPQPGYEVVSERDDDHLTNRQRVKDREMQRAHDAGSPLPFLPSKSRLKRWHTTRKRLEEAFVQGGGNANSLPM